MHSTALSCGMHVFFFFVFFFLYFCFAHLEHRASVKRFVSLQFLNVRQLVGLLGRGIRPLQSRYLTQTQNKHKRPYMPWVRFEPTILVFERAKIFHAVDRAAAAIGYPPIYLRLYSPLLDLGSFCSLLIFLHSQ
jgi:hypothetical protein